MNYTFDKSKLTFDQLSGLEKNKKLNSKTCEHCLKEFYQNSNLKAHLNFSNKSDQTYKRIKAKYSMINDMIEDPALDISDLMHISRMIFRNSALTSLLISSAMMRRISSGPNVLMVGPYTADSFPSNEAFKSFFI